VAGYDIWSGEIRFWWSSPKREQSRCAARCRDGSPCEAPPVWDKRRNRPVNGRCRMHGGLSTGPKTPEGRWRISGVEPSPFGIDATRCNPRRESVSEEPKASRA
jgi:hypothetical protein